MSLTLASRSLLNPRRAFPSLVRKKFHHPPNDNSRPRRFSELTKHENATQPRVLEVKESAHEMLRHGPGDGVITLNVGGKEFHTLRSTIDCNQILRDHVTRAEANHELMKGGSIFIDRDPASFGLILQHLRNKADNVSRFRSHAYFNLKNQALIQVPKDKEVLRDLYVEARHYQIQELEDMLCSYDMMTRIASFFGGGKGGNPFHAAAGAIRNARSALMASGGIGVFMGSQNDDFMEDVKGLMKDAGNVVRGRKNDSSSSKQPSAEPTFAG